MVIKLKPFARKCIIFVVIYMMVINVITAKLGIPSSVRYLSDVIVIILLALMLSHYKEFKNIKCINSVLLIVTAFFVWTLIGLLLNSYSVFLYVWGLRNNFRFFVVFFATIIFFKEKDIEKFEKIIKILYAINLIICLYQFMVEGYWADHIEGIFTTGSRGGNAGVILLLSLETIIAFSNYLNRKTNFFRFFLVASSSMIIAAIGELKFYYVIFALLIVGSLILNHISRKTIIFAIVVIAGVFLGYYALQAIAPESLEALSFKGMIAYAGNTKGYTSSNDINRLLFFDQINRYFFNNGIINKVIGFGLGSCDVSSVSIFMSPFYQRYGGMHYSWFSSSMLYLETGIVGLIIYILFYVFLIIRFFGFRKEDSQNNSIYNSGIILSGVAILMLIYNASMRNDISYFVYVALALPFVQYCSFKQKKNAMSL